MFCNVSYFHFARHKEKFMWGSFFTFIFPFPRAGFGLSDKTDGPSYILLLGKGEHYFQRWTLQNDQSDSCSEKHQVLFKTSLIFPFTICHLSRRNYSCLYVGDGWWIYIIPIKTLVDLLSQLENKHLKLFSVPLTLHPRVLLTGRRKVGGCLEPPPSSSCSKGSRLPLKHLHTSATGIHISNPI